MANCRCGLTGGCQRCRPLMDLLWGDWYYPPQAQPTETERDVAHRVAVVEICPSTLRVTTPYEKAAVQRIEAAILRAFKEVKNREV